MNAGRRRRLRRPPTHWVILSLLVAALAVALLLHGYASREYGGRDMATGSRAVSGVDRSVVDFSRTRGRGVTPPDRTVALTFDDGPDPRWTPEILRVLARRHVPATFFVVGSQVAAHPELVRRELADGHEIGSHTFTHGDLGRIPGWEANLDLNLTQLAIGGATGVHTGWFRAPYSSTPASMTAATLRAERAAARLGYLEVLADRDGEDWRRPGVARIVADATPQGDAGAVVLLHDGGGNRAQTVAALDHLITDLQGRGYRFTTLSAAAGVPAPAVIAPISRFERAQGQALLVSLRIAALVSRSIALITIFVAVLGLLRVLILAGYARRHAGLVAPPDPAFAPPVSVIVPAYNEEAGIEASVRSLAGSVYGGPLEIVVVDDGSSDGTSAVIEGLDLPSVVLVRQANQGKPAALNTGAARATHDVLVMVDGDTVFEADTVAQLVQQLRNERVGAISGNTKVGNRRGLLGRWQHIEYVMGFNLDRRLFDLVGCMPTVPGAIGAFRREALDAVGGVSDDTLAEDTDLTMAINRAGWRVVYEERARAWTEAPGDLTGLWRQRYRWCYGTMQSIWKHRGALRSHDGGSRLGRVGLPYLLLFQVLLPLLGPVFDLFALYGIVFLDPKVVALWWLGFNAIQLVLAMYAFRLDHERLAPLWTLPLQQFVYRQLMYLVVIQSVISAVAGTRLRWHKLPRTGDVEIVAAAGGAPRR